MFRVLCLFIIFFPIPFSGCGGSSSSSGVEIGKPSTIPEPPPLSVEQWKAMTNPNKKYDIDMLERLRNSDPSLKSKKAWKKFMKEVVGPGMKKEMPLKESI